jgi:hypothetical protein
MTVSNIARFIYDIGYENFPKWQDNFKMSIYINEVLVRRQESECVLRASVMSISTIFCIRFCNNFDGIAFAVFHFILKYCVKLHVFKLLVPCCHIHWEEFEDTKGVIRIRTSKKEQITQWPKEKVQKNTQRSTKHTHKTKDRVRCSWSTRVTRRVNLVTNPVINHECGKDREVLMTSGTYPWSFVTQIFHSGQPSHGGDRKTFEVMTTRNPWFSSFLVSSNPLSRKSW